MTDPVIRLRALTKLFDRKAEAELRRTADRHARAALLEAHRADLALRDVDLDVRRGQIQVVMGLSGSGKSTLVRHINRLIEPSSGTVEVDGQDMLALSPGALLEFRRKRISMVFQRFSLLPHRTVLDNVAYGLKAAGVARRERLDKAHVWIERVGLRGEERRFPAQLSGGMQQRVGLARALATDTDILLMDEAFSALDPLIRRDMQTLLMGLQSELGRTIVFITHDLDEALRLGSRIAILKDGQLVQEGAGQEIVLSPADDYVAAFVADVDRGRVLTVGDLAVPAREEPAQLRIESRVSLRDAARMMVENEASRADIVSPEGNRMGQAELRGIVAALTLPGRM
ncbi:quaternary amine ABC transporter ATP-binding protein [Aureimonas populi]|uniref:Quaternary amine transport ATP-binding protein n=1 Tax=Aureimonas populi TaxID=1701758 RepID=A0ABW5CJ25_9HYPH|nr:betaine/proline/choline family ABC transporter ATP-binding protein [Aureimonas populi]